MRKFPCFWHSILVVAILFGRLQPAWAGKLDRAGNDARGESSRSSSSGSSSHSSSSDSSSSSGSSYSLGSSDDGETDPTLTLMLAGYAIYYSFLAVTSPWWAPNVILEANYPVGAARAMRFSDYPYAEGSDGFLITPPVLESSEDGAVQTEYADPVPARRIQRRAAQVGVETGVGVNDGVARFGIHARLQFPLRFQLETDWSLLREHDQEGVDVVLMGRERASVRFAEANRVQFYSGVGPQHFCDTRGCVHGIDFSWGFEAFPRKPVVLGLEGSVGNLGQAFAPGLRARLGWMIGPAEASLGWHQRWVGSVPLGGPFIGVTGWF